MLRCSMIRLGESVSYVRPIELILKVYYMYI